MEAGQAKPLFFEPSILWESGARSSSRTRAASWTHSNAECVAKAARTRPDPRRGGDKESYYIEALARGAGIILLQTGTKKSQNTHYNKVSSAAFRRARGSW